MSNSQAVFEMIESIGDVSGRKDKEVLMKRHLEDELFRKIMVWALDPMITFGVKDLSFLDSEHEVVIGGVTLDIDTFEASLFRRTLYDLQTRAATGGAAKDLIQRVYESHDAYSRQLLIKILAKDLRVNAGAGTVNRVRPGTLFSFDVMLAAKFNEAKIEYPIRVEPKYDGMRLMAIGDQNGFEFRTRSGKLVDSVNDNVIQCLIQMYEKGTDVWQPEGKMVFDGELMGRDFRDTMKQGRKKGHVFENGCFYVFDAFTQEIFQALRDKPNPSETYDNRRQDLQTIFRWCEFGDTDNIILPPSYIVNNFAEVTAFYDSVRKRGLEGLILKRMNGSYHPRRNIDWMKMKDQIEADVIVTGAEEGTGKNEGSLGAIIIDFKGVSVNVGSGFSDEERDSVWQMHQDGTLIDQVVEVWFHEVTPAGSMRHPRFKWFRDDKDAYAIEADAAVDPEAGMWA